jgi:hypothetical protein
MYRGRVTFNGDANDTSHANVREDMRFRTGLGPGHYTLYRGPSAG